MSNWTHAAAVARIDHIVGLMPSIDFEEVFGKEREYGEPKISGVKYLPDGSEGSLQMNVYENPDDSCAAHYVVTIFGDLRDHNDASGVINWFKEALNNEQILMVRQATITVSNEHNGTVNWTYDAL